jgi:hypothetical protein
MAQPAGSADPHMNSRWYDQVFPVQHNVNSVLKNQLEEVV